MPTELHSASSALTITLVAADYNFETVVREFYDDVYRFACSLAKADADAAAFQEGGASALLAMKRQHDLETQGWEDGQFVYLFVGSEPKVSLQGLL